MKYILLVSTFLLVIAFGASKVDALECHRCIYNVSIGAPVHNPKCNEKPFEPEDADNIGSVTCNEDQECFTAPAWLGDDNGKFLVSLERGCTRNTGDGCITYSDAKGFLRICGKMKFCNTDLCNTANAFDSGAGILHVNILALLSVTVFAMLMVIQ